MHTIHKSSNLVYINTNTRQRGITIIEVILSMGMFMVFIFLLYSWMNPIRDKINLVNQQFQEYTTTMHTLMFWDDLVRVSDSVELIKGIELSQFQSLGSIAQSAYATSTYVISRNKITQIVCGNFKNDIQSRCIFANNKGQKNILLPYRIDVTSIPGTDIKSKGLYLEVNHKYTIRAGFLPIVKPMIQ